MADEALVGSEDTEPPLKLGEYRADVEEEKIGE
jgi:hypothetical protein